MIGAKTTESEVLSTRSGKESLGRACEKDRQKRKNSQMKKQLMKTRKLIRI